VSGVAATLAAVSADGSGTGLGRALLAAAVLLGLLALTLRWAGARRRLALAASGWIAVAAGLLLGPAGFEILGEREVRALRPIAGVALTWIGLIVGLQLHRTLLRRIPPELWRWALGDLLRCGVPAAIATGVALAAIVGWRFGGSVHWGNVVLASAVAGTVALGWSPETRSMRLGHSPEGRRLGILVKAGSGLLSTFAVFGFGIASAAISVGAEGYLAFAPWRAVGVLATAAATGGFIAIGCWLLLERVARRPAERLVVTLGTLAVLSGTSEWLHVSPLLGGALCGVVLANLGGSGIAALSSRLKEAELALGVSIFLLAGLLAGPVDPALLGLLVAILLAVRLFLKPAAPTTFARRARLAALRQAPIAIAIVTSAVLLQGTQTRRTLLAAAIVTGLIVFLAYVVRSRRVAEEAA